MTGEKEAVAIKESSERGQQDYHFHWAEDKHAKAMAGSVDSNILQDGILAHWTKLKAQRIVC